MKFEEWWFDNELNLDFYNFEQEEAEKVWNAAIDEAVKVVETEDMECGERYALAEAIKQLKEAG